MLLLNTEEWMLFARLLMLDDAVLFDERPRTSGGRPTNEGPAEAEGSGGADGGETGRLRGAMCRKTSETRG
jgi:hypothetical protein